ncbi:uncharacterized protein [Drosophila takahashii]|uniref:uncharacterized protein n=1 Tax=Drosophila takahashii TaxID=29030 RepID=UPI00389962DA
MEESPEWQAQLRRWEEEMQQVWENPGYPPTPRYIPEPHTPSVEVAMEWAPSPPRWLPEIPPTPRYEKSPKWRPARPPTPRFEPTQQQQQPEPSQQQHPEPTHQQQPEMPPPSQLEPPQPQRSNLGEHHVRTDIPAVHVSHSSRTFVVEGVRWRQQTMTWTWPEGPAEDEAAAEEPRIWEEEEPRTRGIDDASTNSQGALNSADAKHRAGNTRVIEPRSSNGRRPKDPRQTRGIDDANTSSQGALDSADAQHRPRNTSVIEPRSSNGRSDEESR